MVCHERFFPDHLTPVVWEDVDADIVDVHGDIAFGHGADGRLKDAVFDALKFVGKDEIIGARSVWVAGDAYRTGPFAAPIFALLLNIFVVFVRRDEVVGTGTVRIDRYRDRTGASIEGGIRRPRKIEAVVNVEEGRVGSAVWLGRPVDCSVGGSSCGRRLVVRT